MSMNVTFYTKNPLGRNEHMPSIIQIGTEDSQRIAESADPIEAYSVELEVMAVQSRKYKQYFEMHQLEFLCWVDDQKAMGRKILVDVF